MYTLKIVCHTWNQFSLILVLVLQICHYKSGDSFINNPNKLILHKMIYCSIIGQFIYLGVIAILGFYN